jgi:integrase
MPKLTSHPRVIAGAKALDGVRTKYSIDGTTGLILECSPDGGRAWFARYQVGHGRDGRKERYQRLGSFDTGTADYMTFGQAKDAANKVRSEAKGGRDPFGEARAVEVAQEVTAADEARTYDACFAAWMNHSGNKRRRRVLSGRTREEYFGLHKRHVQGHLGHKPVSTITKADLEKALRAIFDATSDPAKGQRGLQATKCYQNIRSVLEYCVDNEYISINPMRAFVWLPSQANPEGKQSRAMTDAELRELWLEGPKFMTAAQWRVMRLAILLGRRLSELAGAQRGDVRLDHEPPYLIIPAHREGNKAKQADAVPLPRMAAAIIKDALNEGEPADPLFVGAATRWTTSKALMEFRRERGWQGQVRFHDTRTLINDQMARLGIPTELRSRTLHHTGDLRQLANTVYSSFDHMPERFRALRLWELMLRDIARGRRRTLRWSR